ncbi:MAG: 30S ribosomal protein S24e [Candidatus Bathyarchaeota archaeon]|nr:MAG: 30S ribosomal protein S24e [Candidatus Bathyarchaeota archaeon]
MNLKIISETENVLLGRREITFSVSHTSAGTPSRIEFRRQIAAQLGADLECVYVIEMISRTGMDSTMGQLRVYDSPQRAKLVERDYILKRNTPSEESAKAESEESAKAESEESAKAESEESAKAESA